MTDTSTITDRTSLATLTLSHYSDHPNLTPRPAKQADGISTFDKPSGLWVSVDGPDDWATWCQAEGFRDTSAQHRHRITLAETANILHLATVEDMTAFHDTYSRPDPLLSRIDFAGAMRGIDWAAVATRYQGIIIAPYQPSLRLSLTPGGLQWYYGWDCASGCIWNPAAIASITQEPS